MLIEQAALRHAHVNIGNADKHANASVGQLLGPFNLVQIFRSVVVDRRPKKIAQILEPGAELAMRVAP